MNRRERQLNGPTEDDDESTTTMVGGDRARARAR